MQTISFRQLGAVVATIALALAVVSIPYVVRSQRITSLPEPNAVVAAAPAAALPAPAARGPTDIGGVDFASGFLVYDWEEPIAVVAAAPAPTLPAPAERGLTDTGDFAFGFLVYDWDPRVPGGIPGFDRWIPAAQPNAPLSHAEVQ